MRTIKFRAWDLEEKQWCDEDSMDCQGISLDGTILVESGNDLPHDVVLQQFTGLLDKNGKEIYEGDIVKMVEWEKNNKELSEKMKITLQEVRETEKDLEHDGKYKQGNGAFNGGSQKLYQGYWFTHRSYITDENSTGSLSGELVKKISNLEKPVLKEIKWEEINDGEWGEVAVGFNLSTKQAGQSEIIGNIYENPELLK